MVRMLSLCVIALAGLLIGPVASVSAELSTSFQYQLSNFSGPVPSQWAQLAVDPERDEVYVMNRRANDIRIFDTHGMEVYTFGEGFISPADLAVGDDGEIFVLTKRYASSVIHRCDYRGEPVSQLELRNLPHSLSAFAPDRLVYRERSLYLVDSDRLVVVVVDATGSFKAEYRIQDLMRRQLDPEDEKGEKDLEEININGFSVDNQGNMLFTIPTLFTAYRMSPEAVLEPFGRPGSAPGKFGVTGGIVADDRGYVYVSDRLRCVVLIFDHELNFRTEFGYRGARPSNLIAPDDLAIDGRSNLYVAQAANRGVSVFKVVYE